MDPSTRDRLTATLARLRSALDGCRLPAELARTARRCVIDIDCALASDLGNAQGRMLLAQAEALITVAGSRRANRSDGDADEG